MFRALFGIVVLVGSSACAQELRLAGHFLDHQGKPVVAASVHLALGGDEVGQTHSNGLGEFKFEGLIPGAYGLRAEAPAFVAVALSIKLPGPEEVDAQFQELTAQRQSVV